MAVAVTCDGCGWVLRSPLRAGRITEEQRQSHALRLSAARRAQADYDGKVLDDELRAVIERLRPRAVFTVIDVGTKEVAVCAAYLDAAGTPRIRKAGAVTWTNALRILPGDEVARQARLAHGIDGLSDADVTGLVRERMPPARQDGGVLVICRPAGWRVPEAVATALAGAPDARVVRISGATKASAHSVLTRLTEDAPLRYPYHLMTVAIDRRTGRAALRPLRLFPAGAARGSEGSRTVWRPARTASDTALAIFADDGRLDEAGRAAQDLEPVALYSAPVPAGASFRVRAALDGPGRIRITEPHGAVPHPDAWAAVLGRVPGRVPVPVLTRVDLVCAVDMAGPPDVVRRRVEIACDLVELLSASCPDGEGPRVGVVTCTDHVLGRRPGQRETDPVTRVLALGTGRDAIAWLRETPAASVRYEQCAPVEDLLYEALRLLAGSYPAGRLPLLLTVAGRLPHPSEQPSIGPHPCPHRHHWQSLMRALIGDAHAICRVVADTLPRGTSPAVTAERAAWHGLGPGGQYALGDADARKLAEDFRVLPADDPYIPLPLAHGPDNAGDGTANTEGDAAR